MLRVWVVKGRGVGAKCRERVVGRRARSMRWRAGGPDLDGWHVGSRWNWALGRPASGWPTAWPPVEQPAPLPPLPARCMSASQRASLPSRSSEGLHRPPSPGIESAYVKAECLYCEEAGPKTSRMREEPRHAQQTKRNEPGNPTTPSLAPLTPTPTSPDTPPPESSGTCTSSQSAPSPCS